MRGCICISFVFKKLLVGIFTGPMKYNIPSYFYLKIFKFFNKKNISEINLYPNIPKILFISNTGLKMENIHGILLANFVL